MATSPSSIRAQARFGPFSLDLHSGDLSRNGRPIRLQEKPRSLLLALAERHGELVSRKELHEHLWPNDTFVDFEDGLNAAMSKLREALDDSSQSPRYIETVRSRGYRFVAKIELISAAPESLLQSDPAPETATPATEVAPAAHAHHRPSFKAIIAAGLTCVLLTGAGFFAVRWRDTHMPVISIAVMPFVNSTGDASREYICNGITEELIARLGSMAPGRLRVIAPASARTYANTVKSLDQIGRELNVQYLIEGSLEQQGAAVRVSAQLVRISDQSRVWADVYRGDLSDQFAFESSVADSVGHALSIHVPTLQQTRYRPGKFEAHDAYLKGLYFLSQRSKLGFEQAVESFSNAVAIDPKYAEAYAQLADTYNLMGQYSWMDPGTARSQAWAAAEQALSLDPSLAEAHAALGFSDWYYRWNLNAAETEFRKAIALEPENVNAHHWYEQMLMTAGRFSEAEQQLHAALDVDPRSPILRVNRAWLYEYEGRFPEAVDQLQQVIAENPNFLPAHYKLWYVYAAMGDQTHAAQQFEWVVRGISDLRLQQQISDLFRTKGYLAALGACGTTGEAALYVGSKVDGARCLASLGDNNAALAVLESAFQDHEGWMIYVEQDPAFRALRSNPGFQQLIAEVKKAA
ncbi:MAG TPA: winged helix-turn-helix domain-containing protein [Terracidiphilus sp.]|nr:winged helix-turn-helix domain-containing protein [Terracidiphilus sp.]